MYWHRYVTSHTKTRGIMLLSVSKHPVFILADSSRLGYRQSMKAFHKEYSSTITPCAVFFPGIVWMSRFNSVATLEPWNSFIFFVLHIAFHLTAMSVSSCLSSKWKFKLLLWLTKLCITSAYMRPNKLSWGTSQCWNEKISKLLCNRGYNLYKRFLNRFSFCPPTVLLLTLVFV